VVLNGEGDGFVDIEANGITDLPEGDGQLVLHRLDGEVEDLGYFLVFKPVFLYQFEDDLTLWGELVDRFFDQCEHVGRDQKLFGIEVDAGKLRMEFVEGIGAVAFLVAEVIEGSIPGGDVEVYLKIVYLFQETTLLPDANEYIGNDLFRGFLGFDHGFGKEEQRGIEGSEKFLIRLLIIKASDP
jgi:hypothetical protein